MGKTIAALVSILLVGSSIAASPKQQEPPNTQRTSDQNAQCCLDRPISVQVIPAKPTPEESEAAHRASNEKADTDRKLADFTGKLAEYTRWLVIATTLLVIATIALGILGFRQGRDTRAALRISRRAAKAAADSAQAARDIVGTERAWLLNSGFETHLGSNVTVDHVKFENGLMIIPTFKNDGRSPAIEVECLRLFKVQPINSAVPIFDIDWPLDTGKGAVGPLGTFGGPFAFVGDAELTKILNQESAVFLYCAVRYKDIFDDTKLRMSATTFEITRFGDKRDSSGNLVPNFRGRQRDTATAT